MAINVANVPPNAVQVLFTEDLIKHIIYLHDGPQYETWRAGPYRHFIFNVFNGDVKKAVNFIDMTLESEIDNEFSELLDISEMDEVTFIDYAHHYEQIFFHKGFDADSFLHYCVRLASMSAYFAQHNLPEAPDIAVYFILKAFENGEMFSEGWDTLNVVAKKYVKISKDSDNLLTPEDSDDELLSDEYLNQNEEDEDHYHILNKDYLEPNQLQKSEQREFETDGLPVAREGLGSEISQKLSPTEDFGTGQALEGISSNESLLETPESAKVASASGKSNFTEGKSFATNEEMPNEIGAKESVRESEVVEMSEVNTENSD